MQAIGGCFQTFEETACAALPFEWLVLHRVDRVLHFSGRTVLLIGIHTVCTVAEFFTVCQVFFEFKATVIKPENSFIKIQFFTCCNFLEAFYAVMIADVYIELLDLFNQITHVRVAEFLRTFGLIEDLLEPVRIYISTATAEDFVVVLHFFAVTSHKQYVRTRLHQCVFITPLCLIIFCVITQKHFQSFYCRVTCVSDVVVFQTVNGFTECF